MMETCSHICLTLSSRSKMFFCKLCKVHLCKCCAKEDLSYKKCGSCERIYSKDDLTVNTCSSCKKCPFCKFVITLPAEGEVYSAYVRGRMLRRCFSCNEKFGEDLMSETIYNNIAKIKDLICHYRSFEHGGNGDGKHSAYWDSHPSTPRSPASKARELSKLDNCVEYFCRGEYDINCFAPLKRRMQVPLRQDELTCHQAPVSTLLVPQFNYTCPHCDSTLMTADCSSDNSRKK